MSDKLVTVATFATPEEAHLARVRLEQEGIRAFVDGEAVVGMAWHYTIAVGGVKLGVLERDARRAAEILRQDGDTAIGDEWRTVENGRDGVSAAELDLAEPAAHELSRRKQDAERALRAMAFGLLFVPLLFYAVWPVLKVFVSEEPLRPRWQRKANVAAAVAIPAVMFLSIALLALFQAAP